MDGSTAWEIPLASAPVAPLVLAHRWLLVPTDDGLTAVRADDGAPGWRREVSGIRTAPAVAGDRIFLSTEDGRIVALRVDNGVVDWEQRIGGKPNSILVADAQLFVGSTDNYLYCLKADTGEVDWSKRTGADVVHRPLVDENNVYFVSLDNVLRALNRGHGVQQWMRALPFRPAWNPVMALDTIVVAGLGLPPRAYFRKDGTPADVLTTDQEGEIAAPLYTFASPSAFGPVILLVTRSTDDATVTASARAIEPPPIAGTNPLAGVTPPAIPRT